MPENRAMRRPPNKGNWPKGMSGNPGGRPKRAREVAELARQHTVEAIRVITRIMRARRTEDRVRVLCAEILLDRAWGRPAQAHEHSGVVVDARVDLSRYSDQQIEELERLIRIGLPASLGSDL